MRLNLTFQIQHMRLNLTVEKEGILLALFLQCFFVLLKDNTLYALSCS